MDEARRFSFSSLNHPPTSATHTPEDLSVLWPLEVGLVFGRMATAADLAYAAGMMRDGLDSDVGPVVG